MGWRLARRGACKPECNVSRYGPEPLRQLSPFFAHGGIPIPGRASRLLLRELTPEQLESDFLDLFAHSVEGLWQGLKRISGETEESMLRGRARKRRGIPEGHDLGYRLLGYAEAKAVLYVPAYLFVLQHRATAAVDHLRALGEREDVCVVDVTFQPDAFTHKPLSHAQLVVDFLNGALQPYLEAGARVDALVDALLGEYGDPERADVDAAVAAWMDRVASRVLELGLRTPELPDYTAWARAHEREELMLVLATAVGSSAELDAGRAALDRWVAAGILTREEAWRLSLLAPVCRFSESWYASPTR